MSKLLKKLKIKASIHEAPRRGYAIISLVIISQLSSMLQIAYTLPGARIVLVHLSRDVCDTTCGRARGTGPGGHASGEEKNSLAVVGSETTCKDV